MLTRRTFIVGGAAAVGVAAVELRRMGTMADYARHVASTRAALPDPAGPLDLVRFATLAASGHNTQPWRFRVPPGRIDLLPDFARRTPAVDPDDHHLFVSLGCAVENLSLAAAARGQRAAATLGGDGALAVALENAPREATALGDAIPWRQSTRAAFDGRPARAAEVDRLVQAARAPTVDVVVLTERTAVEQILELVVAGNTAQMNDPAFVRELKSWIRFNPGAAAMTGDGLLTAASGNPTLPTWLGSFLFDRTFRAGPENEKYAQQVRTSSGIAVFVGARADREHWVQVGRSCQRFALQATALDLRCSFINQPIEVAALRAEVAALVGAPGRRPDLIMRFGHASALPYSPRRPVEAVLVPG